MRRKYDKLLKISRGKVYKPGVHIFSNILCLLLYTSLAFVLPYCRYYSLVAERINSLDNDTFLRDRLFSMYFVTYALSQKVFQVKLQTVMMYFALCTILLYDEQFLRKLISFIVRPLCKVNCVGTVWTKIRLSNNF